MILFWKIRLAISFELSLVRRFTRNNRPYQGTKFSDNILNVVNCEFRVSSMQRIYVLLLLFLSLNSLHAGTFFGIFVVC